MPQGRERGSPLLLAAPPLPPHGHERGSPPPPPAASPLLPHGCKRGSPSSASLLLPMGEKHFHKGVVQITKIKNLFSELINSLSAGMRCCRDGSCVLRWSSGSNSSLFGRWHTLDHVHASIFSGSSFFVSTCSRSPSGPRLWRRELLASTASGQELNSRNLMTGRPMIRRSKGSLWRSGSWSTPMIGKIAGGYRRSARARAFHSRDLITAIVDVRRRTSGVVLLKSHVQD